MNLIFQNYSKKEILQENRNTNPEVHVFCIKTFHDDEDEFLVFLSDEEKERAGRFLKKRDAKTYILAHYHLRLLLSEKLNICLDEVTILQSQFGKPHVEYFRVDFNISHSGDYFAIIIGSSEKIMVGIDIEERRVVNQVKEITKNYMHPKEISYIDNSSERFLQCWTRKEAVLKLLGLGIKEQFLTLINTLNGKRYVYLHDVKNKFNNSTSLIRVNTLAAEGFIISWSMKGASFFTMRKNLKAKIFFHFQDNHVF